jgi:hypothetical protein
MRIDEFFRARMPVEGAIPHLAGIEMYGDSTPAGRWATTCSNTLIFSSATIWVRGSAGPSSCRRVYRSLCANWHPNSAGFEADPGDSAADIVRFLLL